MQNVGVDIKGELKLGVTQTGEIAGGTGLAWTIDLQEGQYASIDYVIESGTMPTLPIIAGPDWAKRLEAEPVEARAGVTVRWLADASGEWHFMLLTLPNAPIRYRLTWKEARAPTEGERRVVIQRSFEASRAIQGQQQFQAYGNAERMMKHAVTLARGLSQPDARTIAVGMGNLGVIHAAMDRPKEADAELREALRAPAGVLDPDDTVPLLYNLAAVRYKLRALGEAQKICEQARQAALAARAPASLPTILSLLGGIQADLGAYGEAEKYFTEAVAAEEKLPNKDPYRQSSLLQNFASLYVDENNYAKADELLRRARTVLESADGADGLLVANLLNWMATIEMERGDFTQAEGHIREAEGIGSRRRNVEVQTQTLRQWGGLHELEGRFSDAKVALEKSLDLLGGADRDSVLRGKVLADLGGIYLRLGDHHRALTALREAQKIFEAAQGPNDIEQCRTLNMMGAALADSVLRSGRAGTAELREAEAEFRRALAVRKQDPTAKYPRAQTILENLAIALLLQNKQDEFAAAMQELARYQSLLGSEARTDMALSMADLGSFFANNARDFSKEELRGVLRSIDVAQEILRKQFRRPERAELVVQFRAARAQVLQRMGDLAGALMEMDEALTGAEALRLPVGGQEESASQYFSRFRKYWDDLVFWRLQNGQTAKAVEDGERVRARLLLAQMQTDMSAIREGIAPEKRHQIERREEEAKRRIASARQRMRSMGTRSDLDEGERQKLLEGAARDEEAAESEYEHVYDEINSGPRGAEAGTGANVRARDAGERTIDDPAAGRSAEGVLAGGERGGGRRSGNSGGQPDEAVAGRRTSVAGRRRNPNPIAAEELPGRDDEGAAGGTVACAVASTDTGGGVGGYPGSQRGVDPTRRGTPQAAVRGHGNAERGHGGGNGILAGRRAARAVRCVGDDCAGAGGAAGGRGVGRERAQRVGSCVSGRGGPHSARREPVVGGARRKCAHGNGAAAPAGDKTRDRGNHQAIRGKGDVAARSGCDGG
jgi:tetratricopeptide (TPR) repeat protein